MTSINEKLEQDKELVNDIENRFVKLRDWYSSLSNTAGNISTLEALPLEIDLRCCALGNNFPQEYCQRIFLLSQAVKGNWEWLNRCSSPEELRLYESQSHQVAKVANKLKGTPYEGKLRGIAEQLKDEVTHPIMPSVLEGLSRKRNLKAYTIRNIHNIFCKYLPIRTSDYDYCDSPWQSSPNKEVAAIASIVLNETVTNNDVTAAISDKRRKNDCD